MNENITSLATTYTISPEWTIPADAVVDTYRGRIGCGCGCRGTYSMRPATVTRRVAEANSRHHELRVNGRRFMVRDRVVYCVALRDHDRNFSLWLYIDADAIADHLIPS